MRTRLAIYLACMLLTVILAEKRGQTPYTRGSDPFFYTTPDGPLKAEHVPIPAKPRDEDWARAGRRDVADPLVAPIHIPGLPPKMNSDHPAGSWQGGPLFSNIGIGEFVTDFQARFHAHGSQVCASGCAASNHPTKELTTSGFRQLMTQCAAGPLDETNQAFETLLFFGRQTRVMLEREGYGPLNPEQARTLWRELSRTHARISIRVIDEHRVVRSSLKPTRVPFDRRHVFDMDTNNLQPLVTSGTVKRVGLHHLWTRL